MANKDLRIDEYIASSAEFARPILKHLRKLVHSACPEVEETLKWRTPTFVYKGLLCGVAAFKKHCVFGFWKHELLFGPRLKTKTAAARGTLVPDRITCLADLPADRVLVGYVKKAMRLNEEGIKLPTRRVSKVRKPLLIPDYFQSALKEEKLALTTFENFSYSHRKEYVEWLIEAKTEETRGRRLATAMEWLAQGKPRHWKYMNC